MCAVHWRLHHFFFLEKLSHISKGRPTGLWSVLFIFVNKLKLNIGFLVVPNDNIWISRRIYWFRILPTYKKQYYNLNKAMVILFQHYSSLRGLCGCYVLLIQLFGTSCLCSTTSSDSSCSSIRSITLKRTNQVGFLLNFMFNTYFMLVYLSCPTSYNRSQYLIIIFHSNIC